MATMCNKLSAGRQRCSAARPARPGDYLCILFGFAYTAYVEHRIGIGGKRQEARGRGRVIALVTFCAVLHVFSRPPFDVLHIH